MKFPFLLLSVLCSFLSIGQASVSFRKIPTEVLLYNILPCLRPLDFARVKQINRHFKDLIEALEQEKLTEALDLSLTQRLLFECGISGYSELRKLLYQHESWKENINHHQLIVSILGSNGNLPLLTEALLMLMVSAVETPDQELFYFPSPELFKVYVDLTLKPCLRYFKKNRQMVDYSCRLLGCAGDIRSLPRLYFIRQSSVSSIYFRRSLVLYDPSSDDWIEELIDQIPATSEDTAIEIIEMVTRLLTTAAMASMLICSKEPRAVPFGLFYLILVQLFFPAFLKMMSYKLPGYEFDGLIN